MKGRLARVVCVSWLLAGCGAGAESTPAPSSPSSPSSVAPAPVAPSPPDGAPAPPAAAGKRPPCQMGQDQACNEDPAVSALWGRCTEYGTCECKPGFELNPWGRCQPAR